MPFKLETDQNETLDKPIRFVIQPHKPIAVRIAEYPVRLIDAMHLVASTCGNRVCFLTHNGVREVHLLVTMMTKSGKIETVTYKMPQSVGGLSDELVIEADETVASVRFYCSTES